MKVGKLRFILYLKKLEGDNADQYEILDFFKTDFSVVLEDKDGKKLPISQYCVLHTNDFLTLSNIDYDVLLPSFQKAEHHYETFNRANWFLLELLNAYDQATGIRKEKLLKACEEFSDWISGASDEELDCQIKTLNCLQTIKRKRDFNIDEIGTLYRMIENDETRENCLVGAYLLLGQQTAAELHYAKLSEEEQKNFKDYPIYHYWKQEDEDNG